jgi:hypothetical protein
MENHARMDSAFNHDLFLETQAEVAEAATPRRDEIDLRTLDTNRQEADETGRANGYGTVVDFRRVTVLDRQDQREWPVAALRM